MNRNVIHFSLRFCNSIFFIRRIETFLYCKSFIGKNKLENSNSSNLCQHTIQLGQVADDGVGASKKNRSKSMGAI